MERDDILTQIAELEREIAVLPEGSIAKKKINGKEYFYHRITRNGRRSEKYVGFESVAELSSGIEKRKALEKELKKLKAKAVLKSDEQNDNEKALNFRTTVRVGKMLMAQT